MKKISAFAALCFSLVAISAFAQPISQDKLSSYQEAVSLSIQQNPLKCVFSVGQSEWDMTNLKSAVYQTTSGEIREDGRQPILILSNNDDNWSLKITTSADYKTVTLVNFVEKQCSTQTKDVNHGTIANPDISPESTTTCTVTYAATCQ